MSIIKLGVVDQGARPPDLNAYFTRIHEPTMVRRQRHRFRGERKGHWLDFSEVPPPPVADLQRFLKDAGFFPFGAVDGLCGYRTMSSMRLFQEYVRTVEGDPSIGPADGMFGPKTFTHVERWQRDGLKADWVNVSSQNPHPEYRTWMALLAKARQHYQANPTAMLQAVNAYPHASDTVKVAHWDFDPGRIHLVGVRRKETQRPEGGKRSNDDVFILLINGLVFKFFGTTDPGFTTNANGAPFLVQGQHKYRFGWHKQSDMDKVYRALKPLSTGVLVVRDGNRDMALTEDDFTGTLERNASINVHWGGRGTSNWSAGCQVICGRGYINHNDEAIDCSAYAATNYSTLGTNVNGVYQTKGAYSVLADLVTAFSGDVHAANYMLLYEQDLDLSPEIGAAQAEAILERIR